MDDNSLTTLPHIDNSAAQQLARQGIHALPQLLHALHTSSSSSTQKQTNSNSSSSKMTRMDVTGILSNILGGTGRAQEAIKVADRLPIVDVSCKRPHMVVASPSAAAAARDKADGLFDKQQQQGDGENRWHLDVELSRRGSGAGLRGSSSSKGSAPRVYAPLFPKVKEEGWWLVVGHRPSLELLAMKRVSFGGKTTLKLNFPAYTSSGTEVHSVTVFLISDCYMGLDQQYNVVLNETAAAAAARTEAAAAARAKAAWLGGASSNGGRAGGDAMDEDGSAAAAAAGGDG